MLEHLRPSVIKAKIRNGNPAVLAIFGTLLLLIGMVVGAFSWYGFRVYTELRPGSWRTPTAVIDRNGRTLVALYGSDWKVAEPVVLADLPTYVPNAFLAAEDARFRNLPVVLTSDGLAPAYDLPNLEIISGEPAHIAANALPLIRQHAFESHLTRTLRSIDADGLLDVRTGLLTPSAFNRDFATAVYQTLSRGGGLSVARFAFDRDHPRAQLDGARIISRLMRQMDFGAARDDGSVIVAFADTDLRTGHMIARRLSSVMRHTSHGRHDARCEPAVTVATMLPDDSAKSLLARLTDEARRAAS